MNKLTALCQQVEGTGKSEKQGDLEQDKDSEKQNTFRPTVGCIKSHESRACRIAKDFAAAFDRKLEVIQWLSVKWLRKDDLLNDNHRVNAHIYSLLCP